MKLVFVVVSILYLTSCMSQPEIINGEDEPERPVAWEEVWTSSNVAESGTTTNVVNTQLVNTPPNVSASLIASVGVGDVYYVKLSVVDSEGDLLSYTLNNLPAWLSFDYDNVSLFGAVDKTHVGFYENISINVSDGEFTSVLGPFSINVINQNFVVDTNIEVIPDTDILIKNPDAVFIPVTDTPVENPDQLVTPAAEVLPIVNTLVANPDTVHVVSGVPQVINVLSNDLGLGGGPSTLSLEIVSAPSQGSATVNIDGSISYLANTTEPSLDTFLYKIADVNNAVSLTSVNINITPNVNALCTVDCTKLINVSWDPSVSENVAGYYLYYGQISGRYNDVVWMGQSTSFDYEIVSNNGSHFYALKAVNSLGEFSDFSQELSLFF